MKRALTGIVAAGIALGMMAPAAFAATGSSSIALSAAGGKSIAVDGSTLYSGVQAATGVDAGTTTSYFPIWYLEQSLTKAGYVNNYEPTTNTWNIQMPGVDATKVAVNGGVGSGNAAIAINGVVVKKFNAAWHKDFAGGAKAAVTTYFPLYYLGNVLSAAGFSNAWNGSSFGFESNYGTAAALKLSVASTIVANDASTVTATLNAVDANGHIVRDYNGAATVTLTGSGVQFDTSVTGQTSATSNVVNFTNGVATVVLKSNSAVVGSTTTVKAVSSDITDANTNPVYTSATITTVAQVASSVSVTPTSTSLADNSTTSEEVDVQVLDQAGQPMLWGSYPLNVSVSGAGTLAEGTNNTYTTAYVGTGSSTAKVAVNVSSIKGQSGPIFVTASSAGLSAGSATINAATVGDAKAIKLALASGSSSTFTADNGTTGASFDVTNVDANGNTVAGLPSYNVTVTDSQGNDAIAAGEITSATVSAGVLTVRGTTAGTYTVTVADPAGNLTSATTSVTITAGAAAKVGLTSPALSTVNVSEANPSTVITAQIEDQYGNAVSEAGDKVEFTAAQAGGGTGASFTLNGESTSNYIVTTAANGQASVTFAAQATPGLSFTVGVDKVNTTTVTGVSKTVDVVGMAPSSLTATTATTGGTATTYFHAGDSVVYTVTEKDAYGNPYPVADRIDVTVPAGMTVPSGSGLSGDATNGYYVSINPATGTASFTLKAGTAGVQTVSFTDASAVNSSLSGSASVSVTANTQSTVTFENGSGAITSSNPLSVSANSPVAIQLVPTDNAGNLAVSASPLYYSLSDPNGGYFTTVAGGAPVSNVTIPGGSTGITLYYVNATASGSTGYYGFTASPVTVQAAPTLRLPGHIGNTNVSAYTVTGTAQAGSTVSVTATSGSTSVTGTATAGSTGAYSVKLNLSSLKDGTVTFNATETNYAGTSAATTLSTSKATPTLTAVQWAASSSSSTGYSGWTKVTDSSGAPISGLSVSFTDNTTSAAAISGKTDSNGYAFFAIPGGTGGDSWTVAATGATPVTANASTSTYPNPS